MQTIGYIINKKTNEKIKLLVRTGKRIDKHCFVVNIKMRTSGSDGNHLEDEEHYLNENYNLIEKLKNGEIINC